jgi:xanthine dehydrogenase YagR molybdenum-binding subunit
MAERKISWEPQGKHALLGTDVQRVDGPLKASGQAKYSNDINTKGTLIGKLLTCTHAHAKLESLDLEKAKAMPGVKAVHAFKDVGDELRWDGEIIAAVAAETPAQADDAIRAIEVKYEVLPHWVDEADLEGAKKAQITDDGEAIEATKSLGENTNGKVEDALKNAKAVVKGHYGIATISHMCLEPHGSHCEWKGEDELVVHLSTQNVSGTAGQFAEPLGLDAANVTINCEYIGGGFGSKFAADEWGVAAATMAKEAGRPVRLMLDRPTELKAAGTRPSGFIDVTIACDEEGKITAWDSNHWGTSGTNGSTIALQVTPYVFNPPNLHRTATGIVTHTGPNRAWRAPNHPQACAYSQTAIDDLAAKLGMDSLDFFLKNLDLTNLPDVYRPELEIAAKLMDWKAKWHPHGKGEKNGQWKHGLGLALHTWGGGAHQSTCSVKIHGDGTAEVSLGSQDIGTGTKTIIGMVAADTFGIPLTAVKVNLGSSKYPKAGPSGGSTTVGGVAGPVRRASQEALWKVFDLVATKHKVEADSLSAKDGKVWSDGKEVCTWKAAAALVGKMPLEVMGEGPKDDGLTSSQVGGVQMAEVAVDPETGVVRMVKMVAVQDMGMILDRLTAKSQILGSLIMGIAYSLVEERIMDNKTGRFINADLQNYKLPRIGDIGELVVEFYEPEDQYNRGVIGLGEPPVIAPGAAISNAGANALGVRVPVLPLTPQRVLDALKGANA